jgi:condensin complex subunit 1
MKISEKLPRSVLRKMSVLSRHLHSESYTIRCALVETIGNLIAHHLVAEETDSARRQVDSLLDILEERFRDVNSYVRAKVLQVFGFLCELKAIFLRRRYELLELVLDRVNDKSSHVRRKAIQNLIVFVRTHPFSKDGGELRRSFFCKRLDELSATLKTFSSPPGDILNSSVTRDVDFQLEGTPSRLVRVKTRRLDEEFARPPDDPEAVASATDAEAVPTLEGPEQTSLVVSAHGGLGCTSTGRTR